MATIGLSIIVKNEADVILRCLESVRPLCDYILVVDTGSSDGTQEIVRAYLARHGLPGEVVERPWRDFATNRTEALELLRGHAAIDYTLMIDADEQLVYEPGFDPAAFKRDLAADGCNIRTEFAQISYLRPQLFRNALPFHFKAVLHEYLEAPPGDLRWVTAAGFVNRPSTDGARSKNLRKYEDDAEALARALITETDPFLRTRYQFYLAQSLRDSGQTEAAIGAYRVRATMGGWAEEIFICHYQIGRLGEQAGHDADAILLAYLRAHEASPGRAEALVAAARFCRERDRFALAYMFAGRALGLTPPDQALFLEPAAYAYGARDELAVAAYWTGAYRECADLCAQLLADSATPTEYHERIAANRAFALDRMAEAGEA